MNHAFTVILILLSGIVPSLNAQTCVIADYPFSGSAVDVSGNNYHGTVFNAVLDEDQYGVLNSSYRFNGLNSHIDLGQNFDMPVRTINLWFNANVIDAQERHIYISDNPALNHGFTQMKVARENGVNKFRSLAGVAANIGEAVVDEGEWYMATLAVGADSTRHYLNGQLLGTFTNGSASSSFGGHTTALLGTSRLFDRFFNGRIDDVKIFDCALTQDEIDDLYESGLCIIADYPFNGTADDLSGNDYHANAVNAVLEEDRFASSESAYKFNGIDSHIDLGQSFDLPVRSVSLWFNADVIDALERHIYISDNPALNNGFSQMKVVKENGVNIFRSLAGIPDNIGEAVVEEGVWYLATTIVGEDSTRHYLNCDLLGVFPNGNGTSMNGHNNALLGTSRLFDRYFNGRIDDLKIFDCEIDEMDVCNMYDLLSSIGDRADAEQGAVKIFPNPVSQILNITTTATLHGKVLLELSNSIGQSVKSGTVKDAENLMQLDVTGLHHGMYLLSITDELGLLQTVRVIVN